MRENGVALFGLESREPIADFDFIGFTLQYELSFTTILHMLDLAGLPCGRRIGETIARWLSAAAPAPAIRSRWWIFLTCSL